MKRILLPAIMAGLFLCLTAPLAVMAEDNTKTGEKAFEAYQKAVSLKKSDCQISNAAIYYIDDLYFTSADSKIIEDQKDDDFVSGTVFYNAIAEAIDEYDPENNIPDYEVVSSYLLDEVPKSKEEFNRYIKTWKTILICGTDKAAAKQTVLEKLSGLKGVTQEDLAETFTITDLGSCAKQLKVSEEMLGYTLAMLSDCGVSVEFDDHSCTVSDFGSTIGTADDPVVTDKESIRQVQEYLNANGYNCGTADGIAGTNTSNAVKAFQKNLGITETGKITERLISVMK